MRRRALVIALGAAVVVAALAAFVAWPRGTSEISTNEAVDQFRSNETDSEDGSDEERGRVDAPLPGVYSYAAEGDQSVKLGPLPTEDRPLPATVTAVAAPGADGCFEWTVNFFAEHTERTRHCVDGESLRLDEHVKHQRIGPLSPTATMRCDPDTVVRANGAGADLECELDLDGGPASINASLAGATTVGRTTTLGIAGDEVLATPVTITYTVTGDLSGSWEETTWWTAQRLPVRIARTIDLRGPATFTEDSELQLQSLEPTT